MIVSSVSIRSVTFPAASYFVTTFFDGCPVLALSTSADSIESSAASLASNIANAKSSFDCIAR